MTETNWTVLGLFLGTFLIGIAVSQLLMRWQFTRQREDVRRQAEADALLEQARDFMAAARVLSPPIPGASPAMVGKAVSQMSWAAAWLSVHRPDLDGPITTAETAILRMIETNGQDMGSDAATEAQAHADRSIAAARAALRSALDT